MQIGRGCEQIGRADRREWVRLAVAVAMCMVQCGGKRSRVLIEYISRPLRYPPDLYMSEFKPISKTLEQ